MANLQIEISGTNRLGSRMRQVIDSINRDREELIHMKAILDQLASGATTTADYAPIEQALNVAGGAQTGANGQAIYNLVAGAIARFNSQQVDDFISRLG